MPDIKFIAAIDNERGIAKDDKLPWDLPTDRKYFQTHVKEGPVIMGWNTFAANNLKPYGKGKNYVLTREDKSASGVEIIKDAQQFFKSLKSDIWVAGGGQVFKEALPFATHLYLTRVEGVYESDVFFPEFESMFRIRSEEPKITENGITFRFQIWERKLS